MQSRFTVKPDRKSGFDDSLPDDTWEENDFIDMGYDMQGKPHPRRNWSRVGSHQ